MGTWGSGNFDSDDALDFVNDEVDRYIKLIEAIFGDEQRFRLDEDAEGMLIPSIHIISLLCEHCGAATPKKLDVAAWKARYLAMYDDQIDGLEPADDFKRRRRAMVTATFDRLLRQHEEQWRRNEE